MKYEKSCGAVIFTREAQEIRYVIIRANNGDYGFPKGHMEAGEDELTTAMREIWEEVGLRPSIVSGFRMEDCYSLPNKSGVTKTVVYFLAEFADQTPRPQPEELADVFLMTYEEAMQMLTFAGGRSVLTEADHFVRSKL